MLKPARACKISTLAQSTLAQSNEKKKQPGRGPLRGPLEPWQQILIRADGTGRWGIALVLDTSPGGAPVEVVLLNPSDGVIGTISGTFSPFSGLPGRAIWFSGNNTEIAGVYIPKFDLKVRK